MEIIDFDFIPFTTYQGRKRKQSSGSSNLADYNLSVIYEDINVENAFIEPMKSSNLEIIPEGYRDKKCYILYTTTKLNNVVTNTDSLSDQVFFDGNWLTVVTSNDFENAPFIIHNEYILFNEIEGNFS